MRKAPANKPRAFLFLENSMALKRTFVPGKKSGKSRTMGPGLRSPVIGRIKGRDMAGVKGRRSR